MPVRRFVGSTGEAADPGPRTQGRRFDAWAISRRLLCPEPGCTGVLALRKGPASMFWGCDNWEITRCKGSIGAHPNGLPLGIPADRRTRARRIQAHEVFDLLWKNRRMSRDTAYKWLAAHFGGEVHIGKSNYQACDEIIAAIWISFPELFPNKEIK